jgi:hypothetical protein
VNTMSDVDGPLSQVISSASTDDVMSDELSGEVPYAILGSFPGMRPRSHAIPWSVLKHSTEKNG